AAVLGGLDTLIFTGGVGGDAAPVRARLCAGMDFLGLPLHERREAAHPPVNSRDGRPALVSGVPTQKDLMNAPPTDPLLLERGADHVEVCPHDLEYGSCQQRAHASAGAAP